MSVHEPGIRRATGFAGHVHAHEAAGRRSDMGRDLLPSFDFSGSGTCFF